MPVISTTDPVDREIEYTPTKAPYDPRWMLAGRPHPSECQEKISAVIVLFFCNQTGEFFFCVFSGERCLAERILRSWLFHGDHGVLGSDSGSGQSTVSLLTLTVHTFLRLTGKLINNSVE